MRNDWTIDVKMRQEIADDVATISRLESVRVALLVLRRATGLRIAVVARVTEDSWTACAVLDEAGFGLLPGDQLDVSTTFCSVVQGTAAPLLINHASADSRFSNHPAPRLYGIESYIAVPLTRRDGTYFGALCALDPLPATLTPESFQMFDLMAGLIAFELEAEDMERSARETAARIAYQAQELARLGERERLAMDLHDGVIQSLYGVVLGLGAHELSSESEEAGRAIEQAIDRINAVIKDIRTNISDLRPWDAPSQSLVSGIELMASDMCGSAPMGLILDLAADADSLITPDDARSMLYIAREATSNVIRHAHATSLSIRLTQVDGCLELSIHDNGQEFKIQPASANPGNGLRNIYERARLIGGTATITSQPGQGTSVVVRVPVPPRK